MHRFNVQLYFFMDKNHRQHVTSKYIHHRVATRINKLLLGYSRKNPHPPDGWGRFLTPPLTWIS